MVRARYEMTGSEIGMFITAGATKGSTSASDLGLMKAKIDRERTFASCISDRMTRL